MVESGKKVLMFDITAEAEQVTFSCMDCHGRLCQ